jgi:hypothetical protein
MNENRDPRFAELNRLIAEEAARSRARRTPRRRIKAALRHGGRPSGRLSQYRYGFTALDRYEAARQNRRTGELGEEAG